MSLSLIRFDQVKLGLPRKTQPHITKTRINGAQEKVAMKAPVQAPGLVHLGQASLYFSYELPTFLEPCLHHMDSCQKVSSETCKNYI